MKEVSILVFPCGSELGLEYWRALKDISFIKLIGASSVDDHGRFVYKNYVGNVPYISDVMFIEAIHDILEEYNIDYIFPALDDAMLKLSENRNMLKAQLLAPSSDTVMICRNKRKTYEAIKDADYVPRIYNVNEEILEWPVIVKPSQGSGSKGVVKAKSRDELERHLDSCDDEQVICEYLSGAEYTVDCFTNKDRVLLYASCRTRNRIRNGISVNSSLQSFDNDIFVIANDINNRMELRGAWFFQLKRDSSGKYKLLEIATRIGGTSCVQRAVGVNLPLLTVFDAMGFNVTVRAQCDVCEVDRALDSCYMLPFEYDEVYIDYDDTIIVHDRVNESIMRLLYQFINNNIPIFLVSKHDGNIHDELKNRRISDLIFDRIIHIKKDEEKSDHISPSKNALFIDDSFAERERVAKKFGIVTYGVDAADALIDWRQ